MEGVYGSRPKGKRTEAPHVPASIAMLAEQHADRPMGGLAGEWLTPAKPEPAPPPPEPLRIEPPPWAGQEGDAALVPIPEPDLGPPLDALSALKAADAYEPPPFSLEPPIQNEPLVRFVPPPPDWREEELQRERAQNAQTQQALEPSDSSYPLRRGAQNRIRWPA
jgi:hypothetical protein